MLIKNKVLYILIVVAVLIVAGLAALSALKKPASMPIGRVNAVEFLCDNNKSIGATFYPDNDTHVDLKLSDGRVLPVPRAISGSGARYANSDESFVFWNKGDTAFITENGTTTYANCALPNSSDISSNNQTQAFTESTTTNGASFRYPAALPTKYIHLVYWPPQAQVLSELFICTEGGKEIAQAGITSKQIISGHNYCVTKESEGAAGSIYTNYAYAFQKNGRVVILTFTLRFVQCVNYSEPNQSECQNERNIFNIDHIIDQITQTLTLN